MDDSMIIELYINRDERAISETSEKYGNYCFAVANAILQSDEDCEECVNDTWLRVWNAIPPHRPKVLRLFLARIVRNLALDRFNSQNAEKRGGGEIPLILDELSECLQDGSDTEAEYEIKELGECISRFVRSLPEREGNVLVCRCFFAESAAEIAKRYDMTQNNVMVMLSRTRKKLKVYLSKEGFI